MDIYSAIMNAASHVEAHPSEYRFMSFRVPRCGGTGCLWGHIGVQLGMTRGVALNVDVAGRCGIEGCNTADLYEFCNHHFNDYYGAWCHDASLAAEGLRAYAKARFSPPEKVVQPPDWNAIASRQTVGEHDRSQELA